MLQELPSEREGLRALGNLNCGAEQKVCENLIGNRMIMMIREVFQVCVWCVCVVGWLSGAVAGGTPQQTKSSDLIGFPQFAG